MRILCTNTQNSCVLAAFCWREEADSLVIYEYHMHVIGAKNILYLISVYKYMIRSAKHFDTEARQAKACHFCCSGSSTTTPVWWWFEKSNYYTLATDYTLPKNSLNPIMVLVSANRSHCLVTPPHDHFVFVSYPVSSPCDCTFLCGVVFHPIKVEQRWFPYQTVC